MMAREWKKRIREVLDDDTITSDAKVDRLYEFMDEAASDAVSKQRWGEGWN